MTVALAPTYLHGRKLSTLIEAGDYLLSLPRCMLDTPRYHTAPECVGNAIDPSGGWIMFAHVAAASAIP